MEAVRVGREVQARDGDVGDDGAERWRSEGGGMSAHPVPWHSSRALDVTATPEGQKQASTQQEQHGRRAAAGAAQPHHQGCRCIRAGQAEGCAQALGTAMPGPSPAATAAARHRHCPLTRCPPAACCRRACLQRARACRARRGRASGRPRTRCPRARSRTRRQSASECAARRLDGARDRAHSALASTRPFPGPRPPPSLPLTAGCTSRWSRRGTTRTAPRPSPPRSSACLRA